MDIRTVVGRNIRSFRRRKEMSQMSLALDAGLDAAHVGKVERGEVAVTLPTLERLADALGICISQLFDPDAYEVDFLRFHGFRRRLECLAMETRGRCLNAMDLVITEFEADPGRGPYKAIFPRCRPRYEVFSEKYCLDNTKYIGYGIRMDYPFGREWEEIGRIQDISTNATEVQRLCARLNENQLIPLHFEDIIEDFLVQMGDCSLKK